jgi:hypothetical protein
MNSLRIAGAMSGVEEMCQFQILSVMTTEVANIVGVAEFVGLAKG